MNLMAFFCSLMICFVCVVLPHARIPYVMCGVISDWYIIVRMFCGMMCLSLFNMPHVFDILLVILCMCALKFKYLSMMMPRKLVWSVFSMG